MPLPLDSDEKDTLCMTKQRVIIRGFEFKRLKNIQSFCRQSFSLVPVLHTDEKAIWRYWSIAANFVTCCCCG